MEKTVKVSIAVATYNGAPYLKEQLDSFVRQTRLPDEIVICDDGSTDETMEILTSFIFYSRSTFPWRIYRNAENFGYSKNFERAISLFDGDVIFLSDQDDVWFPEEIEAVLEVFQSEDQPLVVIYDVEITNSRLEPSGLTLLRQFRSAHLSMNNFVHGSSTAFLSDLLPLLLPIPSEYFPHDGWIHYVGRVLGRRVIFPKTLQFYRRHEKNTSQFLTNQIKPVTLLDLIAFQQPVSSQKACMQRLMALGILVDRLVSRESEVRRILAKHLEFEKIMEEIQHEQEAVKRRLALLKKSRFLRFPQAWVMFKRGDYKYFSGWMSFVKDLFR